MWHWPRCSERPWPDGDPGQPALYSHGDSKDSIEEYAGILAKAKATRKLLVAPEDCDIEQCGDAIIRFKKDNEDLPQLMAIGGVIHIPYRGGWLAMKSPNVCRVLWRIGFSHLADEEANPAQMSRFVCPECSTGYLVLKSFKGEGWFLSCNNWQAHQCYYRRRLSEHDAKLKVRLTNMRCPDGHPLTVRTSSSGFFMACENYPAHSYTESLNILAGT